MPSSAVKPFSTTQDFIGHSWFDEAVFRYHQARFDRVYLGSDADFSRVNFADGACFEGSVVKGETRFEGAQVGRATVRMTTGRQGGG